MTDPKNARLNSDCKCGCANEGGCRCNPCTCKNCGC